MIAIIDYEMGNLRSVQKGFEKVGHSAIVTSDAAQIRSASRVVLPGVGAFEDAMDALKRRDLIEPILEQIQSGKPFLGICLGLQLLFEKGWATGFFAQRRFSKRLRMAAISILCIRTMSPRAMIPVSRWKPIMVAISVR